MQSGGSGVGWMHVDAQGELLQEDIYYPLNIITVEDPIEYRIRITSG